MKKYFIIIITIAFCFLFMDTANAATNYYYKDSQGNYVLYINGQSCVTHGSAEIKANGKINSKNGALTLDGVKYKYDEAIKTKCTTTDWGKVEDIDVNSVCSEPGLRKPLKFIGTFVILLKIIIPILIIVLGFIDLAKSVTSSKQDGITKAVKSIGVRLIAGVFIFFLPGIVQVILNWVNEWSEYENTWCCCTQCILDANNCDVNSCSSDSCSIGGMN